MSCHPVETRDEGLEFVVRDSGFHGDGDRGSAWATACRCSCVHPSSCLGFFIAHLPTCQCVRLFKCLPSVWAPLESVLHGKEKGLWYVCSSFSDSLKGKPWNSCLNSIWRGFRWKEQYRQSVQTTIYLVSGPLYYASNISLYFFFDLHKWLVLPIICHFPSFSFDSVFLRFTFFKKMCNSSSVVANWGWFLSFRECLAMAGDMFDCYYWRRSWWYRVRRGQVCF